MAHLNTACVLVVLLAAVGCAGPDAAWVGEYQGTYECRGTVLETGEPYSEGPMDQLLVIDSDADGAFIAGTGCTIRLVVLTERQAEPFINRPCRTALMDGTPITATVTGGTLQLDDPNITYAMQWRFELAGQTIEAGCSFGGTRTR
jgi:hypothetical protein